MEPGKLKIQLCLLQARKQRLASGKEQQGKPQKRKDLTSIMAAAGSAHPVYTDPAIP